MKSIPTWGWVLIVIALIAGTLYAFRKPLQRLLKKGAAGASSVLETKPPLQVDTTTTTVVQPDGSETVLAKMRRVA